jgi:hypothetical protein
MSLKDQYIAQAKAYLISAYGSGEDGKRKAFDHYASDDGKIGRAGVIQFLTDARIGPSLFHGFIAGEVISKLDTDGDGELSWDELQAGQAELATSKPVDPEVARVNNQALRDFKVRSEVIVARWRQHGLDIARRVISISLV